MKSRFIPLAGLVLTISTLTSTPAEAEPDSGLCPKPETKVTLDLARNKCEVEGAKGKKFLRQRGRRTNGPYTQTQLAPLCAHDRGAADDGNCNAYVSCEPADVGRRYRLQQRQVTPGKEPPAWTTVGETCFTPEDLEEISTDGITPGLVLTEFRRLTWPEADLVIEPPGGEVLINRPVFFHVTNPEPVTQTVTLLGQRVTIQARPTGWTWHWAAATDERPADDDLAPYATTYPGVPMPGDDITHVYRRAGLLHPSVDVTYNGRYRVNDGPWTDLLESHTVAGEPQEILVIEARPVLER